MRKRPCNLPAKTLKPIGPPAYPRHARELFADLRLQIESELQRGLSFQRLGAMIGQPRSTTHYWFEVYDHPHVIAFVALLEWLSPCRRQEFIEKHCRVLPSLSDPRLARFQPQVRELLLSTKQRTGLTILTGGTEGLRTFLVTAFCHTLEPRSRRQRQIAGIDVHLPDDIVPASSLFYFDSNLRPRVLRDAIGTVWRRVQTSSAHFLVFNGVWGRVPHIRPDLLALSRPKHVVLAEEMSPTLMRASRSIATANVIRLC